MIRRARYLDLPADPVEAARVCAALPGPPGSPDGLRAVADTLSRTADDIGWAMTRLRAVAELGSDWCGEAADQFSRAVHEPRKAHIDDVPQRYRGYALALRAYAGDLDVARVDLERARQRVRSALDLLPAAHPPSLAGPPDLGADLRVPQAVWSACADAVAAYRGRHDAWVDSVNSCASRLKHIDNHDHLHNPHGLHAFMNTLSTVLGDLSTVSAVLGVLALAIFPAAGWVLLTVSTITAAGALVTDLDRKFQFGEDVSWATIGADAFGAIPVTAVAHGGTGAVRAAAEAEGKAGKVSAAAREFGRGFAETVKEGRNLAYGDKVPGLRLLSANGQSIASLPVSAAARAENDHNRNHDSWRTAVTRSPFRVLFQPFADAVPAGPARATAEWQLPGLAVLDRLAYP